MTEVTPFDGSLAAARSRLEEHCLTRATAIESEDPVAAAQLRALAERQGRTTPEGLVRIPEESSCVLVDVRGQQVPPGWFSHEL